jgi:hypothetical protein
MDSVLKQLETIKDVEKRLRDLSEHRGTPENMATDLATKAESLEWAHSELKKQFVADSLLLVGHHDFLSELSALPKDDLVEAGELGYAVLIMPDKIVTELLLKQIAGIEGSELPADKTPKWLRCTRYSGCCSSYDPSKRAVLFECVLSRRWLNEVGIRVAKAEIGSWLNEIFQHMKWSDV